MRRGVEASLKEILKVNKTTRTQSTAAAATSSASCMHVKLLVFSFPFFGEGRWDVFFPHSFDFVFFLITNRTENSLLSWKKERNISEFFHFLINKHVSEFAMMDRTHERITWAQQKQSFMYFHFKQFILQWCSSFLLI